MPWSVSVRCRLAPQPHCTVGASRGRMARLRRCRRAVLNSLEFSGRVASKADAGRQEQLTLDHEESGESTLNVLRSAVQGGEQGVSTSFSGMPAVGALCRRNGAHAVLADLGLGPPQVVRLVVQGFPPRGGAVHC
jgi:hypothetical protein